MASSAAAAAERTVRGEPTLASKKTGATPRDMIIHHVDRRATDADALHIILAMFVALVARSARSRVPLSAELAALAEAVYAASSAADAPALVSRSPALRAAIRRLS